MWLDYLYEHEAQIRLASFILVFAGIAIGELLAPRRNGHYSKGVRWINNLSISALNTIITRVLVPLLTVAMAATAHQQGLGLLNNIAIPTLAGDCCRCAGTGPNLVFSTLGFSSCRFFMATASYASRRSGF